MESLTPEQNEEILRFKEIYHQQVELLDNYNDEKLKQRSQERKRFKREISKAKTSAKQILKIIPSLRSSGFPPKDGRGDDILFNLNNYLKDFIHYLEDYEAPSFKRPKGIPEENLLRNLESICDEKTCYYSSTGEKYVGAFVTFLENTLPLILDSNDKTQAFAQRYVKMKRLK